MNIIYLCRIHRTMYHDTKAKGPYAAGKGTGEEGVPFSSIPESGDYEAGLTVIGEFDTVESFCRYFNWLKPPSKLERNSNYHIFKSGIKPMWEDAANAQGGKWVLTMKNNPALLDRCWAWLAMALVGQELEEGDEICGAVVSLRSKVDRIQLWTRSKDDVERLNAIGKKLVKLLDVSEADSIGLEFQVRSLAFRRARRLTHHLPHTFSTTRRTGPCQTSSCLSKRCHHHLFARHSARRPVILPTRVPLETSPVPPLMPEHPQAVRAVAPSEASGLAASEEGLHGEVNEHEAWRNSVWERGMPPLREVVISECMYFVRQSHPLVSFNVPFN